MNVSCKVRTNDKNDNVGDGTPVNDGRLITTMSLGEMH
jgi:hypothetical protein